MGALKFYDAVIAPVSMVIVSTIFTVITGLSELYLAKQHSKVGEGWPVLLLSSGAIKQ